MTHKNAELIAAYRRRVLTLLENAKRKGRRSSEAAQADHRRAEQRAKYNSGAAHSPTPAPVRSFVRDEKLVKILAYAELDHHHDTADKLVIRLAEAVLHEQGITPATPFVWKHKTLAALGDDIRRAGTTKRIKQIASRVQFRERLRKDVGRGRSVRPYAWDKTTPLLRSLFFALAMEGSTTRPFTLAMTKGAVASAKTVKHGFASGLQERLKGLLKRRLPGEPAPFWFAVELGGGGGFHLHGAVVWPHDPAMQARVEQCLLKLSGGDAPNQLKISEGAPAGWASYCHKHVLKARERLGGNTLVATLDVKRRGKELYEKFYGHFQTLV